MMFPSVFKRWSPLFVRIAVTAAALWLVFGKFGVYQVLKQLGHLDPLWLCFAGVITMGQIVLLTWRWKLLHEWLTGEPASFQALFVATGRSLLLGQLMPTTIGTDAVRVFAVADKSKVMSVLRSVTSDRLVGLATLVAIVTATLPLFALVVPSRAALTSVVLIALAGIAGFALLVAEPPVLRRLPFIGSYVGTVCNDLRRVMRRRERGMSVAIVSLASQLFAILLFIALVRGVGGATSALLLAVIVSPALLVASVPVSLGGWGLREATIASAFLLIGADPALGTTASILYGLTNPLGGALAELAALVASLCRRAQGRSLQGSA